MRLKLALWASLASAAALPGLKEILDSQLGLHAAELDAPEPKPALSVEGIQERITTEALQTWASKLWQAANESTEAIGHPTRAIGTAGHNATLRLIFDTLDELSDSFTYEAQPFVALGGHVHGWNLTRDGQELAAKPLSMSPAANVTGAPVYFVPNYGCLPSDFYDAKDTIAVVKRGSCPFGDKAEIGGLAGARSLLIWDPEATNTSEVFEGGSLGTPLGHEVAAVGISVDTALKLKNGDEISLVVDSEIVEIDTVNIIAETKSGDHDNVVFAGAHSDSVFEGPGINDNGSGTLALLEVAKQLSHYEVNNAVRLAWWSAEELGLKGSLYYTDNLPKAEAAKIRLFLDYDMLGSPNYIYEIYDSNDDENPKGSSALRDMYRGWFEAHGYNYTLQPFDGRSDYVGFVETGIPSSGIDAGVEEIKTHKQVLQFGGKEGVAYDQCYHLACDDLDNLDYEAWLVDSKLVAYSVAVYADSLDGFPERSLEFYEQREPTRQWSYTDLE